jgi:hypothetical protein
MFRRVALFNANGDIIGSRMNGIHAGTYTRTRTTNNKIYTHTDRCVYLSEDEGSNWSEVLRHKNWSLNYFNVFNDTLYSLTAPAASLFRRNSLNQAWDTIPLPVAGYAGAGSNLNLIVWNSKYLYTASTSQNCWISNDYGQTWDTLVVTNNINGYYLRKFANNIYAIYNDGKLCKLNNNLTWDSLFAVSSTGNTYPLFFEMENTGIELR